MDSTHCDSAAITEALDADPSNPRLLALQISSGEQMDLPIDDEIKGRVLSLLQDPEPSVRVEILTALADAGCSGVQFRSWIEQVMVQAMPKNGPVQWGDPDREVRLALVHLASRPTTDRQFARELLGHLLSDNDVTVQHAAAEPASHHPELLPLLCRRMVVDWNGPFASAVRKGAELEQLPELFAILVEAPDSAGGPKNSLLGTLEAILSRYPDQEPPVLPTDASRRALDEALVAFRKPGELPHLEAYLRFLSDARGSS